MLYDTSRREWNDWRWQVKNRIATVAQLRSIVRLSDDEARELERVTERFPLAISPYYANLMDPEDPTCPIRRQVVPSGEELHDPLGVPDPIAETAQSPARNVIQIYPDRVAFAVSDVCPVFCRFCFRKRLFDRNLEAPPSAFVDEGIRYIADTPDIRDVLITGGDPLMATDARLDGLLRRIRAIPHVQIIRIGTRMPVALPQRITSDLCRVLERHHPIWINTHFNHPRELTPEATRACDCLTKAGVPLGNQTVLLKGINDDPHVMKELVHGLLKTRVRPYYLFHCHRAEGTKHFRTSIEKGIEISASLREYTSGLANPLYIVDTPRGKVPILPRRGFVGREGDEVILETYEGSEWREHNPLNGDEVPS